MSCEPKQTDEPLGHSFGGGIAGAGGALVALEGWFIGAVEDEDGLDGVPEQADEAVEDCSDGGVGTAAGGLDLELPDGYVDC